MSRKERKKRFVRTRLPMHPTFFVLLWGFVVGLLGFFFNRKVDSMSTPPDVTQLCLSYQKLIEQLSLTCRMDCLPPATAMLRSSLGFLWFKYIHIHSYREREKEREMRWRGRGRKDSDGRRNRGKMPFQTQVAILFFSRGNGLKLKLNSKLMKHILVVTFVSEVINYLHQPCSQQFLSVN